MRGIWGSVAVTVIYDDVVYLASGEKITRAEYESRTGYPQKQPLKLWPPIVKFSNAVDRR